MEQIGHSSATGGETITTAAAETTAATAKPSSPNASSQKTQRNSKQPAKDKPAASTSSNPTGAQSRVAKPRTARPAGKPRQRQKTSVIGEAQREAAAFKARSEAAGSNGGSDDVPLLAIAAFADAQNPPPPPLPAEAVFSVLPEGANPIDRAVFVRLKECWEAEAGRWNEEMQRSFLENLCRARVTRSTAVFTNHYLPRTLRLNKLVPTWGQFMVMRAMYGPAVCFRQKWALEFAARYPLAKEDAWEGVVPEDRDTIRGVLDGTMGMPTPRKRKISIMTLSKERRRLGRVIKRESMLDEADSGGGGGLLLNGLIQTEISGGKPEVGSNGDGDVMEVDGDTWNKAKEAAKVAMTMDPKDVILRMENKYKTQQEQVKMLQAQIDGLLESNAGIRRWVSEYTQVLTMKPVLF